MGNIFLGYNLKLFQFQKSAVKFKMSDNSEIIIKVIWDLLIFIFQNPFAKIFKLI